MFRKPMTIDALKHASVKLWVKPTFHVKVTKEYLLKVSSSEYWAICNFIDPKMLKFAQEIQLLIPIYA